MPQRPNELLPAQISAHSPVGMAAAEGYGLPPDGDDEGGADLGRYLSAAFRFKWMIVALAVVGLAAGVALSRFVRPVYEAQATVQIPGARREASSPVQSARLFEPRGWVEIVRSFVVLDEVVRRRKLYIRPASPADATHFTDFELAEEYSPGAYTAAVDASGSRITLSRGEAGQLESVAVGDSVGRGAGFLWQPTQLRAGSSVSFSVVPPRDAAVALGGALMIIPPAEGGSLLRLQLRGVDPEAISLTLNAVVDRFVEIATDLKREDLTTRTEVLRAQLARSQSELAAADNALEGYRVGTITLPSDRGGAPIAAGLAQTRDPVFGAFFELRLQREGLVNDRDAIQRTLRLPTDSADALVIALGTIGSIREVTELTTAFTEFSARRAEVRRMRGMFTSEHPPLRQLEQDVSTIERDVIRRQSQAVVENLDRRIADLDRRIAAQARELQQIPPRVSEESRRQRNFASAQEIHASLVAAFEQARLAELSAAPDVRALDRAVQPSTPVVDRLLFIIAGGLFGGLGLGIILALLLDRFDKRIRYPDQVTQGLGLDVLGALPLVRENKQGIVDPEGAAHLLESLRAVRMNMTYAHGTAGTFVTTITSPGPGEGKSFLSAHLAKSFADSGHKTLLIDGDTRRGVLHRTLGGHRKPGLLDLLNGSASLEQVIQTVHHGRVDFISCGTRLSAGPELLASAVMAQTLMALRSRYSAIIIDSPPLGAGVDSLVLASLAGSLVLVLRNGVTDRDLAEAKLSDLQRLPTRMLGAVLNDVEPKGVYRYYAYLPGYRAEDEVESDGPTTERAPRGRLLKKG